MGVSVTRRIDVVKQPRGGYINPKTLHKVQLEGGIDDLNPEENVHTSLVGLAVDYLTRFNSGEKAKDAFKISLMGASLIDEQEAAESLVSKVTGLDDESIINATKLSGYDVVFRAGPMGYKPVTDINPNLATIENIRTMVQRSLKFFEKIGPVVLDGFTFDGGYTDTVSTGDGDFTTEDTLWDFKVSKLEPKKDYTLQLLMYWRMGTHSIHSEFKSITKLGLYNPRLNKIYTLSVDEIPTDVIEAVEKEVIGY